MKTLLTVLHSVLFIVCLCVSDIASTEKGMRKTSLQERRAQFTFQKGYASFFLCGSIFFLAFELIYLSRKRKFFQEIFDRLFVLDEYQYTPEDENQGKKIDFCPKGTKILPREIGIKIAEEVVPHYFDEACETLAIPPADLNDDASLQALTARDEFKKMYELKKNVLKGENTFRTYLYASIPDRYWWQEDPSGKERRKLFSFSYDCFHALCELSCPTLWYRVVYTICLINKDFYNTFHSLLHLERERFELQYKELIADIAIVGIPGASLWGNSVTTHFYAFHCVPLPDRVIFKSLQRRVFGTRFVKKVLCKNRYRENCVFFESILLNGDTEAPAFGMFVRFKGDFFGKTKLSGRTLHKEDFMHEKNGQHFFNFTFFSRLLKRISTLPLRTFEVHQPGDISKMVCALCASYCNAKKQLSLPCMYREMFEALYVYNVPREHAAAYVAEGIYKNTSTVAVTIFWPDVRQNLAALKLLRLMYRSSIYNIKDDSGFLQQEIEKQRVQDQFMLG